MNKIKLPSMVEYVKEQDKIEFIAYDNLWEKVINFANFLSQQPNIGMFVPAVFEDGEWRILEAPNRSTHTNEECDQYATALDNVIFEGFEVEQILNSGKIFLINKDTTSLTFFNNSVFIEKNLITTIEDLIPYSLTLTPKFAKELGLI
jgi:deoxyadenosine/deoxycytidine kinase